MAHFGSLSSMIRDVTSTSPTVSDTQNAASAPDIDVIIPPRTKSPTTYDICTYLTRRYSADAPKVTGLTFAPISQTPIDRLSEWGVSVIGANICCIHGDGTVVASHGIGSYLSPETAYMRLGDNGQWTKHTLVHDTARDAEFLPADDVIFTRGHSAAIVRWGYGDKSTGWFEYNKSIPNVGRVLLVNYRQSPVTLITYFGIAGYYFHGSCTNEHIHVINPKSHEYLRDHSLTHVILWDAHVEGDASNVHYAKTHCGKTIIVPTKKAVITRVGEQHFAVARGRWVGIYRVYPTNINLAGIVRASSNVFANSPVSAARLNVSMDSVPVDDSAATSTKYTADLVMTVAWSPPLRWHESMITDMRYVNGVLIVASDTAVAKISITMD